MKKKTDTKKEKETVVVMGLGYVGLPLALLSKQNGYNVIGYDVHKDTVKKINQGVCPLKDDAEVVELFKKNKFRATQSTKQIAKGDIVLICVPTPVDESQQPIYDYVIDACENVAKNLKKGALVVLESTVNPGTSEEIIRPIFERAGHKIGKDVFIAHCPERIDPGKSSFSAGYHIGNIPRVVGAFTKKGTKRAVAFYKSIIDAEIRPMKSIREAEAVKILENSFRDINIAFINEIAQGFDALNIDIIDVIEGAKTKPYAFMAHYPSCGVGGHCIPVDPYYLIEKARRTGFDHKFMRNARTVNNYMPQYTVERMQEALNAAKMPMNGTVIGVLGLAYKPNVDDVRESPSFKIIKHLAKYHAKVVTYDPHVPHQSDKKTLTAFLKKVDAIILATNHDEFVTMDLSLLKKHNIKAVVDGKNCLDSVAIKKMGIVYRGIGRL